MGVCADALCYLPFDKARQDEQHLGDQVVECRLDRDLLIEADGLALLQGIATEAAITIVDEVECRVARHHLAMARCRRTRAVWPPSGATTLSWKEVSRSS
jgi:hypothetical protein